MKRTLILRYALAGLLGSVGAFSVFAEDPKTQTETTQTEAASQPDTIADSDSIAVSTTLDEVVVESGLINTTTRMTIYTPTKKQKNASQSATDLINRLALPQLQFTGLGGSLKTVGGQDVSVFIDYIPASGEDQQTMRMEDVKSVQYYDYPDDPRFQGKAHVVNFIMQKYEYGGYVKATAAEHFIANSTRASLYGRVSYKKLTYDAYLGGYYTRTPHNYNDTYETYRIPQTDGSLRTFERNTLTDDALAESMSLSPTLKVLYATEKTTIRNTLSGSFSHSPISRSFGHVEYIPADFEEGTFGSAGNSDSKNYNYSGYFNFILPKNNSLSFFPYYSYSSSRSKTRYDETGFSDISYDNRGESHNGYLWATFDHNFNRGGRLRVSTSTDYSFSRSRYSGTSSANEIFRNVAFNPELEYSISRDKFYAGLAFGYSMNWQRYGGKTDFTGTPSGSANIQLTLSPKHSLSAWASYQMSATSTGFLSTAIIQQHPLMWTTGNPHLRPMKRIYLSFNYNWVVAPWLNISPNVWLRHELNPFIISYEPYENKGLLKVYTQDGVGPYTGVYYSLSASSRLFNNSLVLWGRLGLNTFYRGAPYDTSMTALTGMVSATYYIGSFNVGVIYQSRDKSAPDAAQNIITRNPYDFTITGGWANADWNVTAYISNPNRWNWKGYEHRLDTPYYSTMTESYATTYHAWFYLSATYTFGFGKKISHGDEAGENAGRR